MVSHMAINLTEPPGTLYQRTRALLHEDKRDLLTLHKESGLPFYWLRKISTGEINDPGVNRIQKLYEFLGKESLQVK